MREKKIHSFLLPGCAISNILQEEGRTRHASNSYELFPMIYNQHTMPPGSKTPMDSRESSPPGL